MIDEKMGQVSFGCALKDFFRGYVDFRGRSTRAGYWWMQLAIGVIWLGLYIWIIATVVMAFNGGVPGRGGLVLAPLIVAGVFALAMFLPSLAVSVRRYRDAGLRGRGTAVILLLQYAIAATLGVAAYQRFVYMMTNMDRLGVTETTLPASGSSGFGLFLNLITILLGLFLFVLTLLPSDTMLTSSHNDFVRFFIRPRPDAE